MRYVKLMLAGTRTKERASGSNRFLPCVGGLFSAGQKPGLISPFNALHNAASIAGLMLTTQALVAELKEDEKKGAPAAGPRGAGGI